MFKFIHAADLHLDSPLRGLEKYQGAPVQEIREAARLAFRNLIDLAIAERVAFIVIAGDVYDGDWRSVNTGLFFIEQMGRLKSAGIRVFMISGNHDAANRMSRSLQLPDNVVQFSSDQAHTVVLDDLNTAIHGQSFATAAVTTNLSESYPNAVSGRFNLGILHTCATGKEGHANYAPCTVDGLKLKGYDYWALGHIHLRETLCESPYVAFSGNIQGRHIRESGPKGALLVRVEQDRIAAVDFRAVDVLRWERVEVDLSAATVLQEAYDAASAQLETHLGQCEGRTLAIRVAYVGASAIHEEIMLKRRTVIDETRSLANVIGSGSIWIEKVEVLTKPRVQSTKLESFSDDALAELMAQFDAMKISTELVQQVNEDALKKLPGELRDQFVEKDDEWLTGVIAEAKLQLLQMLRQDGGAS